MLRWGNAGGILKSSSNLAGSQRRSYASGPHQDPELGNAFTQEIKKLLPDMPERPFAFSPVVSGSTHVPCARAIRT